jgi:tRNA(Ile)-lysidine synthase
LLQDSDFDEPLNDLLTASSWYVAFSGGLDSTVLLHLLHRWCEATPAAPALRVIHINHGLQASANDWQRQCEALCRDWQLPFVSCAVEVSPRGSLEAAARSARYRAFEQQLPVGAVLFMGHHLDDQIETFFLRLMRGAGVDGLAGMPRQRKLGAGQLVRPLLRCARAELEEYAVHHNLTFVEDPSNGETTLDRNYLRAEVLPVLGARWPHYRQSVDRAMTHLATAAEVVSDEAGVPETVYNLMGDPGLTASCLLVPLPEVAAARLRAWLSAQGCRAPDRAALVEFLRQLRAAPADGHPRLDCGSYALQRYREVIYLEPEPVVLPTAECYLSAGESVAVPGVGILTVQPVRTGGISLLPGERLVVRWRQGGERCQLPGRAGSRSLKTLMQELAVPPWWRDRVPLVWLGDEMLAVGDLLRCDSTRWQALAPEDGTLWEFAWKRPESTSSD